MSKNGLSIDHSISANAVFISVGVIVTSNVRLFLRYGTVEGKLTQALLR